MSHKINSFSNVALSADICSLEAMFETKRDETYKTLECLAVMQNHALKQLMKTQVLFKWLNWKQMESINNQLSGQFSGKLSLQNIYGIEPDMARPAQIALIMPTINDLPSSRIQRTRELRKNILQFGIIQARAMELIEALAKATAVFSRQYKKSYNELFPWGFISKIWRTIKRYNNWLYYSWQEMKALKILGLTAGFVLEIAETPVLGGRR